MTIASDTDVSERGRHTADNAANQCAVSGSNWTLCSALTTVALVAAALILLWHFPAPAENWLIIAVVAAALAGCAVLRYNIHSRQAKLLDQTEQSSV